MTARVQKEKKKITKSQHGVKGFDSPNKPTSSINFMRGFLSFPTLSLGAGPERRGIQQAEIPSLQKTPFFPQPASHPHFAVFFALEQQTVPP